MKTRFLPSIYNYLVMNIFPQQIHNAYKQVKLLKVKSKQNKNKAGLVVYTLSMVGLSMQYCLSCLPIKVWELYCEERQEIRLRHYNLRPKLLDLVTTINSSGRH